MADEITATIEALNQKLAEALRSHDFETFGAMHTNDAVMLAPASNIIMGKGNIQSFWEQKGRKLKDVKFSTLNVKPVGDSAAVEVGTFRMRIDSPATPLDEGGGGPQSRGVSAKYAFVWQKVDGGWKITNSSWNRIGGGPPGSLKRA